MFGSADDIRLSDILFGNEADTESTAKVPQKDEEKSMWKKNVRHYKILSIDQIIALEEFFIGKQIPVTKTNIKHASKVLRIPYQRSVNYLYGKYRRAQENAENFHQKCIHEFGAVMENIEKCWALYLRGCKAYGAQEDGD